jgi:thiol:disulfide interchange protein DsbD|tara:strand:+ start:1385 stop:1876 length:492 start_codon:yes stop_codon:yes gene_type:complete
MKMSCAFQISLTLLLGTFLLAGNVAQAQLTPRTISGLAAQPISPQPLSLEQAFPFYVSAVSPGRYRVVWHLPDGHYLYRHAFEFTLSQQTDSAEQPVEFSMRDGLKKNDQFFGDIEAYYGQLDIDLSLNTVPSPNARIFIHYQGCADWGFCYPPQRFEFLLSP